MTMERQLRGHEVQSQDKVIIRYRHFGREEPARFDLLIDKLIDGVWQLILPGANLE